MPNELVCWKSPLWSFEEMEYKSIPVTTSTAPTSVQYNTSTAPISVQDITSTSPTSVLVTTSAASTPAV
jgi:hypothetical protein